LLQVVTGTFPLESRFKSTGTEKRRRACYVRRHMRVEAAGTESCRRRQSVTFRAQGTAAHNACIRELLQEVNVHGKADRHMRLLTIETESRLATRTLGSRRV
jgi:hypothetical protein